MMVDIGWVVAAFLGGIIAGVIICIWLDNR